MVTFFQSLGLFVRCTREASVHEKRLGKDSGVWGRR